MKAMPTIATPPPRAASIPSETPAIDGAAEPGGFAAALDLAREPAKSALERPAKTAALDDAAPEVSPPAGAPLATDATLPLPGWPASLPAAAALAVDAAAEIDADPALGSAAQALATLVPLPRALRHAATTVLPPLAPAPASPPSSEPAAAAAVAVPAAAADPARSAPAKPLADLASASAPAWSTAATPAPPTALHAAPATGPAAATPFAAHLAAAVDSPAFAPALASQVNWLVREGMHEARLTLNPAEMGPVAVKIMVEGAQARIDFHAAMASTRAAIEASLPALAAALHDSGLTLVGGGVSDGQGRQGAPGDRSPRAQDPSVAASTSAALPKPAQPLRAARGLVDLVA